MVSLGRFMAGDTNLYRKVIMTGMSYIYDAYESHALIYVVYLAYVV